MCSKDQLCLSCRKCGGLCSWSKNFTPVEGWTATPTKIPRGLPSYKITACPEYEYEGLCLSCKKFQEGKGKPEDWHKSCDEYKGGSAAGYDFCLNFDSKYKSW